MKISYNWLGQFIKLTEDAEKTGELLTDLGLEVEGIESFQSVKGGLEGVVVGHVVSCRQHPNADRLKITEVDVGQEDLLQIVCGAPNVEAGQNVPVALVGTTLYDDKEDGFLIKKSKIRGQESYGMICSEDELGLGKGHEGIMVLDASLKPGITAAEVFGIENDYVFEIGLTPNRADAMSHWGVGRDLKAGYQQRGENLELRTPSVSNFHVESRNLRIPVAVENSEAVPRYCGITISDVKIGPSPAWLQNRLKALGLGPKNNVVDATNYVLHELGQPLHAFDADKISGNQINVKTLEAGTKFTTLDGVERTLHEEDVMICDAEKPLAIAGVFGGIESGVTQETNKVFIESAYFNPVTVRKTAKRHGLSTDASFRYERGIDPRITDYALKRVVLLIKEIAGGTVTSELEDYYPHKAEDFPVFLTFDKINNLIGENLSEETIKSILASLEIRVNNITETGMGLTIPPYRVDVRRESDVIEEILRVYGYNNVKSGEKINASMAHGSKFDDYRLQNVLANQLAGQGFYETMANSLTSPSYIEHSELLKEEHVVKMLNPLSQDLSVMRSSMLFSGLETVRFNLNRKRSDLKIFEFGKTYHQFEAERVEKKHLSLFVTGNRGGKYWGRPLEKSDFFFMKGVVTTVLERLGITDFREVDVKNDVFAEGLSLKYAKKSLVDFGLVSRRILKAFDIEQEVLYADFEWDNIVELLKTQQITVKPIPKYQAVRRDYALLLDDAVLFEDIFALAHQTERKLLKDVNLFDVYMGEDLPKGKKSYAVSFTFQDQKKTLTDKQIDKIMARLQQKLESNLGAQLR